jgi:hypothetical protein
MTFIQFEKAVDNLVREWVNDEPKAGAIPRAELKKIYNDVSEQGVHRLAEAMRQRDEALRLLHKKYLVSGRQPKQKENP